MGLQVDQRGYEGALVWDKKGENFHSVEFLLFSFPAAKSLC